MMRKKRSPEKTIRDIRRATRKHYSAEGKIRIVLEGLRGEDTIAELCRREGLNSNVYYRWSKEFMEASKKRLAGDTAREATSDEVKQLRAESSVLKETLGELLSITQYKTMSANFEPQSTKPWTSTGVASILRVLTVPEL
jgi:transposase